MTSHEPDVTRLPTEQPNPRTSDIDVLEPEALVARLHAEYHRVADALDPTLPQIARVVKEAAARLRTGGHIFYAGAGTSGRLGVLDASECPPTFGVDPSIVQGVIAGGDQALRNAAEGAEDDRVLGARDLADRGLRATDVVVAIAASGRTPYALGALDAAKAVGALAVALVNVPNSLMADVADLAIEAVTGPEPITGSTRMLAGTAQKMALNLISTATMVRMGKTLGNRMVDVRATNVKLRKRAVGIVMDVAGANEAKAQKALEECGWATRTAIVMLALNVDAATASARLSDAGGSLRAILNSVQ